MNPGGISPISSPQLVPTEGAKKAEKTANQPHPTQNTATTGIQGPVGPRRNSNDFLKAHGIESLPPGVIATGMQLAPLPPRPPGVQSPAIRRQNIFHGTRLTIAKADEVVLPHVLHHLTDSNNDDAIKKNGFDNSKTKEDPHNKFSFNPSGAENKEELERHISRGKSVFFGLGETDRQHMQTNKREEKEIYGGDASIHHAMLPSSFSGELVPDENNPPGRNYCRIEGSVPATSLVAEPVESRPLALEAIDEHIKNAGYSEVSPSQVENYMKYMIEKFDDEEQFQENEA